MAEVVEKPLARFQLGSGEPLGTQLSCGVTRRRRSQSECGSAQQHVVLVAGKRFYSSSAKEVPTAVRMDIVRALAW